MSKDNLRKMQRGQFTIEELATSEGRIAWLRTVTEIFTAQERINQRATVADALTDMQTDFDGLGTRRKDPECNCPGCKTRMKQNERE